MTFDATLCHPLSPFVALCRACFSTRSFCFTSHVHTTRDSAPQTEVFDHNCRSLRSMCPKNPSACMPCFREATLTWGFANGAAEATRGRILPKACKTRSMEIIARNLESNCRFGNFLRARVHGPSARRGTVYEVRSVGETREPSTKRASRLRSAQSSAKRAPRAKDALGALWDHRS